MLVFTGAQLIVRASVNAVLVVGGIAVVEEAPEGARAFAVAMLGLAGGAGFALSVILLPIADFGPDANGLFTHRIHELRPFDRVCKAWEVFDFGGDGELSAGLEAFKDEGS
jgi:hypothetical protein